MLYVSNHSHISFDITLGVLYFKMVFYTRLLNGKRIEKEPLYVLETR